MVKCEYCGKEIGLLAVRFTWLEKDKRAIHDSCLKKQKKEDITYLIDKMNNLLIENKIFTRKELDEQMKLIKEKVQKKEKELLRMPIKELLEEIKQEEIISCRRDVQITERWIKISEKNLDDAKKKKDEKSIEDWEDLLESFKKINTDLYDEINRMKRT